MMTLALTVICQGSIVSAQSQKDICQALNVPINDTSNAFGTLSVSINSLDVKPIIPKLNGELKISFEDMETARVALLPYLNAYLVALEDAALLVKRCSR